MPAILIITYPTGVAGNALAPPAAPTVVAVVVVEKLNVPTVVVPVEVKLVADTVPALAVTFPAVAIKSPVVAVILPVVAVMPVPPVTVVPALRLPAVADILPVLIVKLPLVTVAPLATLMP